MPKTLTCSMSNGKEAGLAILENVRDKHTLYSRNEKNSGYKELRLPWLVWLSGLSTSL